MPGAYIVTGAAGFIGSHLSRSLIRRGGQVVGVDNFDPFYERSLKRANQRQIEDEASRGSGTTARFEFVEADVRDRRAMEELFERVRPEGVFHIAAMAGVRPSIADPAKYAAVNVEGLINVLEATRSCDCRRFIFASSSSVYGNNEKVPFAETDPVDEPISPYAATKKAGELICHTYSHLYGISVAALRFFTVYGPAQRPDLAIGKFMRLIAADEEVPMYGDGSTSRDYTYIDDIITGVLASYDRVARAEAGFFRIYNLGGSHPVGLAEMIEQISRTVGKTPRIRQLPMQPGDVKCTFADLTRSRAELGYEPKTVFEEGLAEQWRRQQGLRETGG
ncbi:MAG: GDP-mannose 4,6-dehydratase [Phycisphaerales bacterium]|nr:MAG: GDP-mannose 4,6-dehydratase [Phycisphaerales bacterium]